MLQKTAQGLFPYGVVQTDGSGNLISKSLNLTYVRNAAGVYHITPDDLSLMEDETFMNTYFAITAVESTPAAFAITRVVFGPYWVLTAYNIATGAPIEVGFSFAVFTFGANHALTG